MIEGPEAENAVSGGSQDGALRSKERSAQSVQEAQEEEKKLSRQNPAII
jgi:hypothetical protein